MQNAGKDKKGWRKDKLIRIEFNFSGVRLCSMSVHYTLPYHYLCMYSYIKSRIGNSPVNEGQNWTNVGRN